MNSSQKHSGKVRQILVTQCFLVVCIVVAVCSVAAAQQGKSAPANRALAPTYEGTAKNNAGELIPVTLELTEKEGALSGMIRSSHGDFTITGGSHHGEEVTIQFDAGGPTGTVSLKMAGDQLSGTWSAGDDGGTIEVKKAAAKDGDANGKS